MRAGHALCPYDLRAVSVSSFDGGKPGQARGKFGLRTRTVRVHEATFIPEAEQQLLSTALSQWQRKAEADVAASALDVNIAGQRLLHFAARHGAVVRNSACSLPP